MTILQHIKNIFLLVFYIVIIAFFVVLAPLSIFFDFEYECLLCNREGKIYTVLFFTATITLYFTYQTFYSRRISLRKLAEEYHLNYVTEEILGKGIFIPEAKFNIINGQVGNASISFFDYYNPQPTTFDDEIDKNIEKLNVSEGRKRFYKLVLTGKTDTMLSEKISYLEINGVKKLIGFRPGNWNLANYSTSYCYVKTIKKIFKEFRQFGHSETFNSLKMGDTKKFYLGRFPFVKNV